MVKSNEILGLLKVFRTKKERERERVVPREEEAT